jgi:UPF0148 protein
MKHEDEIMAQYLLKGGKMLAKTCPTCGCPLFEYKGETLCVVCQEANQQKKEVTEEMEIPAGKKEKDTYAGTGEGAHPEVREALEETIVELCVRIREEPDPERVKLLVSSLKKTVETLTMLP